MLESFTSFNEIVIFIIAGLIEGAIYDILSILKSVLRNNIIVNTIVDFFASLLGGVIFLICIFRYEYGGIYIFEVISFVLGILFEHNFIRNLFASPIKYVYNKVSKRKISQVLKDLKEEK